MPWRGLTLKRNLFMAVLVMVATVISLGVVTWVVDVHDDREHDIRITGPVRVYEQEFPPTKEGTGSSVIQILRPRDRVEVRRIHTGPGYEAIRIRLHDGREGYIFCCDNFELE